MSEPRTPFPRTRGSRAMGSVRGHSKHGGSSGGGTAAQRSGRRDTVFQRRGLEIPRTPGSAVCPRGACCGHLQPALCLVLVGALISCSAVGSLRNLTEHGISGIHVWACTRQSGRGAGAPPRLLQILRLWRSEPTHAPDWGPGGACARARLTALFWTSWASSIQLIFPFTPPLQH